MTYIQRKAPNKYPRGDKEYKCDECSCMFIPTNHGNTKRFCSHKCANANKLAKYKKMLLENPPAPVVKTCKQCGAEFVKNKFISKNSIAWASTKFCSRKCVSESQKINDGLTTSQRGRRNKGASIMGSEEWKRRIKEGTIKSMNSPEVKAKISKPKGNWTDERKSIQSNKLKGIIPKNILTGIGNGSFPNVKRGEYECSKGSVYFRSKWEANYALVLDFLIKNGDIKDWEFESERFIFEKIKFGTRSYTPDFKVFNNDGSIEFHEIKGYMDGRSKTKLRRMEQFYPEVKLKLIDSGSYKDIIKKMKGIIKFY